MNIERKALKRQYGTLFASISEALFRADPAGISFEFNTDEYDPKTGTIIVHLSSAQSAEDVQAIVYEEFCRWFSPIDVGPIGKYAAVAAEIWTVPISSNSKYVAMTVTD